MALIPITPPAGIVTAGTEYANSGRWVDGNLVRFQNGFLRPIGGWERIKTTALSGTPIGIYSYRDDLGARVLAIGTREKIYVNYNDNWIDITPTGFNSDAATSPLGYGAYHYGEEDFGDARSQSGLAFDTKSFAFANWGELLVFCSGSDGKIYKWDPNSGATADTIATVIHANAPLNNTSILVSNERHLIAFGSAADPRKVAWSSREDFTTWTAASTNTAGSLNVPTGGRILGAKKWETDIIIFTDSGINRMYYSGSPFVYGIQTAGDNCKTLAIRSVVSTGNTLYWLGENSIFSFDGQVSEVPCEVHDFIYGDLNHVYRQTACGGYNSNFNEIIWFFPSGSSQVPNKYIIYNHVDKTWSKGELDRSCWFDAGSLDYPVACDSSGFVYQHESRVLFNSPNLGTAVPFCKTGPLEINNGNNISQVNHIITDEETTNVSALTLSFKGKFAPNGPETDFGSFTFDSADGYTDARFVARQVQMTVTGTTTHDFKVGKIRADIRPRGRR